MVKKAVVIGPIVPFIHHVAMRTSHGVGCAVQLEGGEVRFCVFNQWASYPPIADAFAKGEIILVQEEPGGHVKAICQIPAVPA